MLLKKGFPDVRLPKLGIMDSLLGLLPGILSALIVASLVLTSLGHSTLRTWQFLEFLRTPVFRGVENAFLNPFLGRVHAVHMALHALWMPTPPPLLSFILP